MIEYRLIERGDLAGVIKLCEAEPWPSYTKDAERTWKVLTAPGVYTVVAVEGDEVAGFAQMQSDSLIQAHLSLILVAAHRRRQSIGTQLVREAFCRCGAERVDVITEDMPDFYRSFAHKEWFGFRIHPQYDSEGRPTSGFSGSPTSRGR